MRRSNTTPFWGRWVAGPPVDEAVEKISPERDRVVDAIRALSLIVVVLGHCLMAVVVWRNGIPVLGNLLATSKGAQTLTWLFQIMPLFFWAGGAANAISWERHIARGGQYPEWIWRRTQRLLRPVLVYLAVMSVIAMLITVLVNNKVAAPLLMLTTQLLWFLGAYLIVAALTPLIVKTLTSSACVRWATPLLLLALTGASDFWRFVFHGPQAIGLLNFVLVWTIPAVLGAWYASGFTANRQRMWVSIALIVVGLNLLLVHFGPWPLSMVGMPGEPITNVAPPTLVLALHTVGLVSVIHIVAPPMQKLLANQRLWKSVVAVNLVTMTLYLWHLPTLIALVSIEHATGLERPTVIPQVCATRVCYPQPAGWGYAPALLVFTLVFVLAVYGVIRLMWPFEYVPLPAWDARSRLPKPSRVFAACSAALGVASVGAATLALAATGLGGFPTRIVHYAGVPLNAVAAILLLLFGGVAVRFAGVDRTLQPPA
jgi:fucose 4-O-acetylase-like acetyltransferase